MLWLVLLLGTQLGACLGKEYPLPPRASAEQCAFGLDESSSPLDCFPEQNASEEECLNRGCCWHETTVTGRPYCYFIEKFSAFNVSTIGTHTYVQRVYRSPYPADVENVTLQFGGNNHIAFKFEDADNRRWIPIYPKLTDDSWHPSKLSWNKDYQVKLDDTGYILQISRGGSDAFLTVPKTLIFADQFVQATLELNNVTLYGVGEHRTRLVLDDKWTKYTLWNHDAGPGENANLYGSHPFIVAVQAGNPGSAFGIYFHNSNAAEIAIQPGPKVTFRSLGGILEFHIIIGVSPADVVGQYTKLVGLPAMPPYWALGFHLCRWGYGSSENTRAVWQRMRDAKIPFDVQWNDIDYMRQYNDFTLDLEKFGDLPQLVQDIHDAGMHYVSMVDPGVSGSEVVEYHPYSDGIEMDVFVKDYKGDVFLGHVWNPNITVFPDFTHPRALEYWTKQLREFRDVIKYDAIWIDMNEPSNNAISPCPESSIETPPFVPALAGGSLQDKTMCLTNKFYAGSHYNIHNIFAISEADVTRRALEDILKKRSFLISRASSPGLGRYSGHWSGDNYSGWGEMVASVVELLTFSLYGVPFMGADICGFGGETDRELCNRWSQLGAFYTFSRNHNTIGAKDQDPAIFDEEVIASVRKALSLRYLMLPYLYTLFYEAQVNGATVARPLFLEFPDDVEAMKVDRAFLWGSGLYIVPVLEQGATSVTAYLPKARWFNLDLVNFEEITENGVVILDAPFDTIPLLLRGGSIIPMQLPLTTTTESRKQPLKLIVLPDEDGNARGNLFWDDGESLDPINNGNYGLVSWQRYLRRVSSTVTQWNTETLVYGDVTIVDVTANQVTLNGRPAKFKLSNNVLTVDMGNLTVGEPFDIIWLTA